jgi:hypothetical protein
MAPSKWNNNGGLNTSSAAGSIMGQVGNAFGGAFD